MSSVQFELNSEVRAGQTVGGDQQRALEPVQPVAERGPGGLIPAVNHAELVSAAREAGKSPNSKEHEHRSCERAF